MTHTKSIAKCKGQKTIQKWNNKNKSNANSKKNIWKAISKKHQVQCQIHGKILEKTLHKSFHHTPRTPMQNQGNNSGKPYRRATTKQPKKKKKQCKIQGENLRNSLQEDCHQMPRLQCKIQVNNLDKLYRKATTSPPNPTEKLGRTWREKGTTNPPIIHIKIHRNILGKNIQKTETQKLQSQNQILKETHNT